MTHTRRAVTLLGLLLVAACSGRPAPIDWSAAEKEGRVVDQPAGMDAMTGKAQHRWSDGAVQLAATTVLCPSGQGLRLSTVLSGASGHDTSFILDTGSSGTFLSAKAPLMQETRLSRQSFQVLQGSKSTGFLGHLPIARIGLLESRDLTVGVIEESHTEADPANILGIVHLFHLQLARQDGAWWLRSGSSRRPTTEPGWANIRLEPGTPFLKVIDPNGASRYAMIDTGAPMSVAVDPNPTGTWTVPALDGRTALQIHARKTVYWKGLNAAGYDISLLIGMDLLASRDWRMTFDEATWAIARQETQTR